MSWAVAMDIGGSSLRAALVDARGKIARAVRREMAAREPQAVLDGVEKLVRDLEAPPAAPMAVGLAAVMRVKSGEVVVAPNLGWREVRFGAMLAERFHRPVRLVNDLDAIA
ncbi:MAG: ROK family protein, partial [Deltaproteobacteria bacterium]|nr:ROK family protein [Deltaproteobacteria bacterium]